MDDLMVEKNLVLKSGAFEGGGDWVDVVGMYLA